jgi:hypothetical protein
VSLRSTTRNIVRHTNYVFHTSSLETKGLPVPLRFGMVKAQRLFSSKAVVHIEMKSRDFRNPFQQLEMDFIEIGLDLAEIGCEMRTVHIEMKC